MQNRVKPVYLYNPQLCPCSKGKEKGCPRYLDCDACVANHRKEGNPQQTACEKKAAGPTTVFLVRHGTTDWNKAMRYQGRADNPLDEEGEKQGACLRDYFREIPVDLGVTSPLMRARKTLMYCLETQDHEVPVIVEPGVIEIDFGDVDGLTGEEIKARYPEFYRMYVLDEDRGHARAPGGESLVEVYDRMRDAVLGIAAAHQGETVVIASHGTAIQSFLNFAYGIPAPETKRFLLYNVSVCRIDIDPDGKTDVKYIGDKHHVPEELQFSYGATPRN